MQPVKGRLTSWKDDRGFGFIKADDGDKNVFLYISALPKTSRRPQVGDIILYQRMMTPEGKIRAVKASIQGVAAPARTAPRNAPHATSRRHSKKQSKQLKPIEIALAVIALATVGLVAAMARFSQSPELVEAGSVEIVSEAPATLPKPECNIKGNISINTGRRLYHLPGMEDYNNTNISPDHGERWFCTEEEAQQNGWIKAPR